MKNCNYHLRIKLVYWQNLASASLNFWLDFFAEIIPNVEILFGQMQSHSMNSAFADAANSCFTTAIQRVLDEVGKFICSLRESVGDPGNDEEAEEEPRSKRAPHSNKQFIREAK